MSTIRVRDNLTAGIDMLPLELINDGSVAISSVIRHTSTEYAVRLTNGFEVSFFGGSFTYTEVSPGFFRPNAGSTYTTCFIVNATTTAAVEIQCNRTVTDGGGNIVNNTVTELVGHTNAISYLNQSGIYAGFNDFHGSSKADVLVGTNTPDIFLASGGNDTFYGQAADDIYELDSSGDSAVEEFDEGFDRIRTSTVNVNLAAVPFANIEAVELTGLSNLHITGNDLLNWLNGNTGNNVIDGAGGNDRITGGLGSDTLYGGEGNDVIYGDVGQSLDHSGNVNDGGDVIDGGAGNDKMLGTAGNDTYYVTAGDEVIEGLGSLYGIDTVISSTISLNLASYGIYSAVENARLMGALALNIVGTSSKNVMTGNGVANRITGMGGSDVFDGGLGNDTYVGGTGNDTYYFNGGSDSITESGGIDLIRASIGTSLVSYGMIENLVLLGTAIAGAGNGLSNTITGNDANNRLDGGGGNDTLYGMGGDDTLNGSIGRDLLVGGLGNDSLNGGDGNDTYIYSGADGLADSSGIDLVQSEFTVSIENFGAIENVTLTGTANRTVHGNGLANVITGNSGANSLYGYGGNDQLNGGTGGDLLVGGDGNDTLNGGTGSNVLSGGAGNDMLISGVASDRLEGGAGNDTFVPQGFDDEYFDSGGIDTIWDKETASIETLTFIENVVLLGSANIVYTANSANNSMTGNSGHNDLFGLGGRDTLNGGAGNDWLVGGAGNDVLTGGAGNDGFVFVEADGAAGNGVDRITDFTSNDRIVLDQIAVGSGPLLASAFVRGPAALDANDRIIYNAATGDVYFDADGTGAAAQIRFLDFLPNTTLSAGNFFVV